MKIKSRVFSKNSSISSITKGHEAEVLMGKGADLGNKDAADYYTRKKNSVLLNQPYNFDGNLILASSNAQSVKKGYKTAGTTITNK